MILAKYFLQFYHIFHTKIVKSVAIRNASRQLKFTRMRLRPVRR